MRTTWPFLVAVVALGSTPVAAQPAPTAMPATASPITSAPAPPAASAPAPTTTGAPVQPPAYAAPDPDAPNPRTAADQTELGVALGLLVANGVHDVTIAPSAGRFVAERFELAAIASVSHTEAAGQSATLWSALAEPSYHLALDATTFAVLGMAVGAAYEHRLGTGLVVAPRIALSVALGRYSIVTTALAYQYLTYSAAQARDDAAVVALTSALRLSVGYAVRW